MDKNKVMKEIANLAGFESIDAFKQYVAKNGYREEYWMGGIIDTLKVIESQQEDSLCATTQPRRQKNLPNTSTQPQHSYYRPSFRNRRKEHCRT